VGQILADTANAVVVPVISRCWNTVLTLLSVLSAEVGICLLIMPEHLFSECVRVRLECNVQVQYVGVSQILSQQ
jgi:hypothetical protein